MRFLQVPNIAACAVFAVLTVNAPAALALSEMSDQEMSSVNGTGIAIGLKDIKVLAGPTSRFEFVGEPVSGQFQQADARYYGISVSGDQSTSTWAGACGAGVADLGCPIGNSIPFLAPFDNPFFLRVFDYNGINYQGTSTSQSVFEFLAPTEHDPARVANWHETIIGGNTADKLQGQLIFGGTELTLVRNDARFNTANERVNNKVRMISHTDPNDETIGFIWHNVYRGDFRYSVNQTFDSFDEVGTPPIFGNVEGFYALDIQTYFPMGQMFYQSLILDDTAAQDGNFKLELTRPNELASAVINDFYSTANTSGYQRRVDDGTTNGADARPQRYYDTHGHFRVGDWTPPTTCANDGSGAAFNCIPPMTGTNNSPTSTSDGLFFVAYDQTDTSAQFTAGSNRVQPPTGSELYNYDAGNGRFKNNGYEEFNSNNGSYNEVNIGDGRIEGMLIQHMELVTEGI